MPETQVPEWARKAAKNIMPDMTFDEVAEIIARHAPQAAVSAAMPTERAEKWWADELINRAGGKYARVPFALAAFATHDNAALLSALQIADKALEAIQNRPTKDYEEAGMDCGNSGDVYEDGYQAGLRSAARKAREALSTIRALRPQTTTEEVQG